MVLHGTLFCVSSHAGLDSMTTSVAHLTLYNVARRWRDRWPLPQHEQSTASLCILPPNCVLSMNPVADGDALSGAMRGPAGLTAHDFPASDSGAALGTLVAIPAALERSTAAETAAPLSRRRPDGSIESVMDELLLQYLRRRGYHVEPAADEDVVMADPGQSKALGVNGVQQELDEVTRTRLLGDSSGVSLEQYAQSLGLRTDACAANHLVRTELAVVIVTCRIDAHSGELCSCSTG